MSLNPPDPPESPGLQDPEELRLDCLGHITDLIQKDRSAVGHFQESPLHRFGIGERAPLVAEEF